MKCKECGGGYESEPEWSKDGKPLNLDCLVTVCDSCQLIRQGTGRCWACGEKLDDKRQDKECFACPRCLSVLDGMPGVEIPCPRCGADLQQDPENLSELWCPRCLEKMAEFRLIE